MNEKTFNRKIIFLIVGLFVFALVGCDNENIDNGSNNNDSNENTDNNGNNNDNGNKYKVLH